jgi:hypothetical protein
MQRQQRLIDEGKIRPPSNADALGEIAAGMRASGENAAAAQAALRADQDAGKERLRQAPRDDMPEPETEQERMDRFVDHAMSDKAFYDTLSAQQRIGIGHRLRDRELEAKVREEDAANGQ